MKEAPVDNTTFTFIQVLKSSWLGYKPLVCSKTNTKYNHSLKNRWLINLSGALGVFVGFTIAANTMPSLGLEILISAVASAFFVLLFWFVSSFFFTYERVEEISKPN